MRNFFLSLGGGLVTLVLAPVLASWLSALGTELKWFDSPSSQIWYLLEKTSALSALPLYNSVVAAIPSAAFGYLLCWMIMKRKSDPPELAIGNRLEVTDDAVEASRRIGLTIEAVEKAISVQHGGGPIADQLTFVAGQITATSLSLSALGIHLPTLSREHPNAYLQSYKSLLEAIRPLVEAGHFQAAEAFAQGLKDRLPDKYLYRPKNVNNGVPDIIK